MAYEFFVSYTRANNDAYLQQFVKDISEAVADRRGRPRKDDVRFFDQNEIELGDDWEQDIVEGLQTSPVVLALFSPAYFKSEYCGKELAIFRDRCAALAAGGKLPPLIKPIIWVPFKPECVPASLASGQYTFGDPQAVQNTQGFKYILKQLLKYQTEYNDLIIALAEEIISATDEHPLPRLPHVAPLAQVKSLFAACANAPAPAGGIRAPSGPKHVRFVYVAADPQAFGNARRSDAYVDTGGSDWKPFFPVSTTRVHRFVQSVVANDELDFTSEEMPFGPNLLAEIDDAWQRRQIVVLIVDGWSLNWSQQYRDVLQQLDHRLDYHWCVLVPWNEQDQDSVAIRADIERVIGETFDRHANLSPNPMFYRAGIRTADDLRIALREVLTRLKEEIKKRAPLAMPIPTGPSKPTITGPSRQG